MVSNFYLEKYTIGDMLTNRESVKEYQGLGLATSFFLNYACELIYIELLGNKRIKLEEIAKKFNLDYLVISEMIDIYNKHTVKLSRQQVVQQLKTEHKKQKLGEFLEDFKTSLVYLDDETIKKKIEYLTRNYLQDNTKEENKFINMIDLLNTSEENKNIINLPYKDLNANFKIIKGNLITVGSRTSMGKTAFCLDLAIKLASDYNIVYVNLEMSKIDLLYRILANISEINLQEISNYNNIIKGNPKYIKAVEKLKTLNLNILDCENNDYKTIINNIQELDEKKKQDIVIIDYLTLMKDNSINGNKNNEIEYIVNNLKLIAKKLNICIVIVSQLSREIEKREDKKPKLSDLRDSGGVEQASDVVLLLYRQDYYTKENSNPCIMEVFIAKNRQGETTETKIIYDKTIQKFYN